MPGTVAVTVVDNKYYFDGVEAASYSVGPHTYTFTGVPSGHKMAWMGSPANTDWDNAPGNSNGVIAQVIDSIMRRFRYGDAQLVVSGSFSPSYFRCYTHGDMNGVSDMIVYNPACILSSPPPSPLPPSPPPIPPQVQYTEVPNDNCDILLTQSECQSIADFNERSMTIINTPSAAPACYLQTYNNIYFFNEALTSTVTCEVSDYATCLCGIASPPPTPPPPLLPPSPSQPVVIQTSSDCVTHTTERDCMLFAERRGGMFFAASLTNAPTGCSWNPTSVNRLVVFNTITTAITCLDYSMQSPSGQCVCVEEE